jgi:cytohesin
MIALALLLALGQASGPSTNEKLVDAVQAGKLAEVRALLARGADPNAKDETRPVLLMAVESERLDIVRALLEAGADPNGENAGQSSTAFLAAIGSSQLAIARALVAADADVEQRSRGGETAMHRTTSVEVLRFLVSVHANVNAANLRGETALMTAAADLDVARVRFLLEAGADVWPVDRHGETALHRLLESGGGDPPWVRAQHDILELLLAAGADPNAQDTEEMTPLDAAASICDVDSVKRLRAAGADVESSSAVASLTSCGGAALDFALEFREVEGFSDRLVEAFFDQLREALVAWPPDRRRPERLAGLDRLLELGVPIDARATRWYYSDEITQLTPLMYSAVWGQPATAEWLVERGATIDARDATARTPLMLAAEASRSEMMSWLLAHGADPNARRADGSTPLMVHIRTDGCSGETTVVRELIARGADPWIADADGQTALSIARDLSCTATAGFGRFRRRVSTGPGAAPIVALLERLPR